MPISLVLILNKIQEPSLGVVLGIAVLTELTLKCHSICELEKTVFPNSAFQNALEPPPSRNAEQKTT
jgi:hypothetical protein